MKPSTLVFKAFSKLIAGILLFSIGSVSAAEIQVPSEYATIQAAVDAATDGDTIHIAPGVYVEQVNIIGKNLTLVGQPGTILRAFPGMAAGGGGGTTMRPVLFVYETELVTLRGLTFEGDQLASQQANTLIGVHYRLSGAKIEGCRFTGFREKTPGSASTAAIRVDTFNQGAGEFEVTIRDNSIADCYTGIQVGAEGSPAKFNILIEDNVIQGVGPNSMGGLWGMRGLSLGKGVSGWVAGNTISDFSYVEGGPVPRFPLAWGIIAVDGDVGSFVPLEYMRFEDNTFRNNNLHMLLVLANESEVVNNRFGGTAPSQFMAGLWFSGEDVLVQGNQFREMETGIRAAAGASLIDIERAVNASAIDNRFCGVDLPIEIQRGASMTETGTMTCASPESELESARVVRVTWPGYYGNDYVLEGAPAAEGPWNLIETTLSIENGSLTAHVPTEEANQFFRLRKVEL